MHSPAPKAHEQYGPMTSALVNSLSPDSSKAEPLGAYPVPEPPPDREAALGFVKLDDQLRAIAWAQADYAYDHDPRIAQRRTRQFQRYQYESAQTYRIAKRLHPDKVLTPRTDIERQVLKDVPAQAPLFAANQDLFNGTM